MSEQTDTATLAMPIIDDAFESAWKKIMHSHWWGGGMRYVPDWKKEMLPLTWAEKTALAKFIAQFQPQVNTFRDERRKKRKSQS